MKKILALFLILASVFVASAGTLPIVASPWTTTANPATALAALGGAPSGSSSLNTTIIPISGNYVIGTDTNLMTTTNVIYSVNTINSNIVIFVPSNFPNSFAIENDNTNVVVISNTPPTNFRVASGTNQPTYAQVFSNSYPMKVFWLTQLNATNQIVTGERIVKSEIQRIADGEIAVLVTPYVVTNTETGVTLSGSFSAGTAAESMTQAGRHVSGINGKGFTDASGFGYAL